VGEVVFAAFMFSILLGIGWASTYPYLYVLTRCFLYLAGILVFPYAIISMAVQLYIYSKRASAPAVDEKTLIRFYDDQKRLKLVVSSDAVLYIEADDNYVHIFHLDNGRVRKFTLRSSMRSLEEVLQRHGLVRCHRSYFLNALHVDLLKKDQNGYMLAKLDRDGLDPIPVSKRYYEAVTAVL
jgi:DNA-binding LytR/AlgR family response regulator